MNIGAIVQARTSSTRLPQKVLLNLPYNSNLTVLQQVIRRLKRSQNIGNIIIATTHDQEDNKIVSLSKKEGVKWFKGSKEDVLARYYLAAKEYQLYIIIRVASDCPCIDPHIIDMMIDEHLKTKADYTSNGMVRTFPHGLDAEVISFSTLERA